MWPYPQYVSGLGRRDRKRLQRRRVIERDAIRCQEALIYPLVLHPPVVPSRRSELTRKQKAASVVHAINAPAGRVSERTVGLRKNRARSGVGLRDAGGAHGKQLFLFLRVDAGAEARSEGERDRKLIHPEWHGLVPS